jgi:hypothetical protein
MIPAANAAGAQATERLNVLLAIQKRLEQMQKLRDREPDKRWQAHYDVMLAQIVAYQVKAYEYRACLAEMVQTRPRPSKAPSAQLSIEWDLHHSPEPKAPKEQTSKKYARPSACSAGHRAPPQDPLGRPGPGRAQPRPQRPACRVASQPEVSRTGQARAEILRTDASARAREALAGASGRRGQVTCRGHSFRCPRRTSRRGRCGPGSGPASARGLS